MAQRIILSQMIAASRDCGWTRQLYSILSEKLTDADLVVFNEWLKVAIDERRTRVHQAGRKNKFGIY